MLAKIKSIFVTHLAIFINETQLGPNIIWSQLASGFIIGAQVYETI